MKKEPAVTNGNRLGFFEGFSMKVTRLAGSTPAFMIALALIVFWTPLGHA